MFSISINNNIFADIYDVFPYLCAVDLYCFLLQTLEIHKYLKKTKAYKRSYKTIIKNCDMTSIDVYSRSIGPKN